MATIIERLSNEYIEPALAGRSFSKDSNHCFRKWSTDELGICSIVQPFQYRHPANSYTVELGFFSQFIHGQFGLPYTESPEVADCNSGGLSFRLESLLGFTITKGWSIESDYDLEEVGGFFKLNIERLFTPLIDELATLSGWEQHFLRLLSDPKRTGQRVFNWSMYTYSILGQDSPDLVKAQQAIQSHTNEPRAQRLQAHLDRQNQLVKNLKETGLR